MRMAEDNMRTRQHSHSKTNFSYLDLYEQQSQYQKKMENVIAQREREKDAEVEAQKPALFQRESRLSDERKKQLMEQTGLSMRDIEEQEAYKKMNDKLEIDFTKDDHEDHEKMREFFKISDKKS